MNERRMYAFDKDVTERVEAAAVCAAVLDVLSALIGSVDVDVYSDYEAVMPDEVRSAQTRLSALGEERNTHSRDPRIGLTVTRAEPAWTDFATYAPWSINVDIWDADHDWLGEFNDSGSSVCVRLDNDDAASLRERLATIAPLALLSDIRRRRREARRLARRAAVRRLLGRARSTPS